MRTTIISATILGLTIVACGPAEEPQAEQSTVEAIIVNGPQPSETTYDSLAAAEYGADDYGMKKYVMAFLKSGPNRDLDSAKAMELQMAHLNNIERLADEGKLVVAGPFFDGGDLRGIYIFNVQSIEEAEALTNSDPAIQAGSLVMELKEWYSSAALVAINDIHKTLQRKGITEH